MPKHGWTPRHENLNVSCMGDKQSSTHGHLEWRVPYTRKILNM